MKLKPNLKLVWSKILRYLGFSQNKTSLEVDEGLQSILDEVYQTLFLQKDEYNLNCAINKNYVVTPDGYIADVAVDFPQTIYVFYMLNKDRGEDLINSVLFEVASNLQSQVKSKFDKNCYVVFITQRNIPTYIYDTLRINYKCVAIQADTEQFKSALLYFRLLAKSDKPSKEWLDFTNNNEYQNILDALRNGYTKQEIARNLEMETDKIASVFEERFSTT